MLVKIDDKFDVWISSDIKCLIGERGLTDSTFLTVRIQEGIQRGQIRDVTFRRGRKSLILYAGGWGILTHASVDSILSRIEKAQETSRSTA